MGSRLHVGGSLRKGSTAHHITITLYNLTVFLQDGWTALHLAAQEGKDDVGRLLIGAQAKIALQTEVYTCILL